ncbi:LOW QUALITY PROTEIN: Zinc finger protein 717, partial [Galemys pyrenaicus]
DQTGGDLIENNQENQGRHFWKIVFTHSKSPTKENTNIGATFNLSSSRVSKLIISSANYPGMLPEEFNVCEKVFLRREPEEIDTEEKHRGRNIPGKPLRYPEHVLHHMIQTMQQSFEFTGQGKAFNKNERLFTHRRTLIVDTACKYNKCGKTYDKSALITQEEIHVGETPGRCNRWGKISSEKPTRLSLRRAHFEDHTGNLNGNDFSKKLCCTQFQRPQLKDTEDCRVESRLSRWDARGHVTGEQNRDLVNLYLSVHISLCACSWERSRRLWGVSCSPGGLSSFQLSLAAWGLQQGPEHLSCSQSGRGMAGVGLDVSQPIKELEQTAETRTLQEQSTGGDTAGWGGANSPVRVAPSAALPPQRGWPLAAGERAAEGGLPPALSSPQNYSDAERTERRPEVHRGGSPSRLLRQQRAFPAGPRRPSPSIPRRARPPAHPLRDHVRVRDTKLSAPNTADVLSGAGQAAHGLVGNVVRAAGGCRKGLWEGLFGVPSAPVQPCSSTLFAALRAAQLPRPLLRLRVVCVPKGAALGRSETGAREREGGRGTRLPRRGRRGSPDARGTVGEGTEVLLSNGCGVPSAILGVRGESEQSGHRAGCGREARRVLGLMFSFSLFAHCHGSRHGRSALPPSSLLLRLIAALWIARPVAELKTQLSSLVKDGLLSRYFSTTGYCVTRPEVMVKIEEGEEPWTVDASPDQSLSVTGIQRVSEFTDIDQENDGRHLWDVFNTTGEDSPEEKPDIRGALNLSPGDVMKVVIQDGQDPGVMGEDFDVFKNIFLPEQPDENHDGESPEEGVTTGKFHRQPERPSFHQKILTLQQPLVFSREDKTFYKEEVMFTHGRALIGETACEYNEYGEACDTSALFTQEMTPHMGQTHYGCNNWGQICFEDPTQLILQTDSEYEHHKWNQSGEDFSKLLHLTEHQRSQLREKIEENICGKTCFNFSVVAEHQNMEPGQSHDSCNKWEVGGICLTDPTQSFRLIVYECHKWNQSGEDFSKLLHLTEHQISQLREKIEENICATNPVNIKILGKLQEAKTYATSNKAHQTNTINVKNVGRLLPGVSPPYICRECLIFVFSPPRVRPSAPLPHHFRWPPAGAAPAEHKAPPAPRCAHRLVGDVVRAAAAEAATPGRGVRPPSAQARPGPGRSAIFRRCFAGPRPKVCAGRWGSRPPRSGARGKVCAGPARAKELVETLGPQGRAGRARERLPRTGRDTSPGRAHRSKRRRQGACRRAPAFGCLLCRPGSALGRGWTRLAFRSGVCKISALVTGEAAGILGTCACCVAPFYEGSSIKLEKGKILLQEICIEKTTWHMEIDRAGQPRFLIRREPWKSALHFHGTGTLADMEAGIMHQPLFSSTGRCTTKPEVIVRLEQAAEPWAVEGPPHERPSGQSVPARPKWKAPQRSPTLSCFLSIQAVDHVIETNQKNQSRHLWQIETPTNKTSTEERTDLGKTFNLSSIYISRLMTNYGTYSGITPEDLTVKENIFLSGDPDVVHAGEKHEGRNTPGKSFQYPENPSFHQMIETLQKPFQLIRQKKAFSKEAMILTHKGALVGTPSCKYSELGKVSDKSVLTAQETANIGDTQYRWNKWGKTISEKPTQLKLHRAFFLEEHHKSNQSGKNFSKKLYLTQFQSDYSAEMPEDLTMCEVFCPSGPEAFTLTWRPLQCPKYPSHPDIAQTSQQAFGLSGEERAFSDEVMISRHRRDSYRHTGERPDELCETCKNSALSEHQEHVTSQRWYEGKEHQQTLPCVSTPSVHQRQQTGQHPLEYKEWKSLTLRRSLLTKQETHRGQTL